MYYVPYYTSQFPLYNCCFGNDFSTKDFELVPYNQNLKSSSNFSPVTYYNHPKLYKSLYKFKKKYYKKKFNLDFIPAETDKEYKNLVLNKPHGMIKNLQDFRSYVHESKLLANVDKNIFKEFEESLKFCNGGLGGAYYGELADKLTYRQFEELFARFGISMKLFCDRSHRVCRTDLDNFILYCGIKSDEYCSESYCPDCI